jgi:nucleotide-binding universal stress UspA family protein
VHVLSAAELNLSSESAGLAVQQYKPAALHVIERFISELKLTGLSPPEILIEPASTTSRAADALSHHAMSLGAELIVVGSHGRTGVSRLLLGSFAETLLQRSKVPVMVIGPHMHRTCELDHVLFPTAFGESSKLMFRRVVKLAREYRASITLYHAIPRMIEPIYQSGIYLLGSPWIPVNEYYASELTRHHRHADAWARWARKQGVQVEVVMDTDTINIAESIVELARKRKMGWIAMAAQNGPIASALLGSVTRQVIRIAECPVWVLKATKHKKHEAESPKAA